MLHRSWQLRVAGWIRLAAWVFLLHQSASPWTDLGGIVSERLRWLHRFCLWMGLAAGAVAGRHGREAGQGRAAFRRRWYRLAWYPLAGSVAVLMVMLAMSGGREAEIGIVLTGFLACWAGGDFGFTLYPMLHGRLVDEPEKDHAQPEPPV